MTAQIRPTRIEVNDRFPMLGLTVHSDEPDIDAEVVLATNIGLFQPQNRAGRTAANFYSSREHGYLSVPRGDGVFIVPPEVLARFIGNDRLYFGLATGRRQNGGLHVEALPRDGSPYISLQGFTGRTLRRSVSSGRRMSPPVLEWTGDAARPGSEPSNGANPGAAQRTTNDGNGQAAAAAQGMAYDDGFGFMPAVAARPRPPQATAQSRYGLQLGGGLTAQQALDWIRQRVEQVVGAVGSDVDPPSVYRLGDYSSTFRTAWSTVLTVTSGISPLNAFLAELPALADNTGITLSVGPGLDTPVFGAGAGVVFEPGGQVALFGASDISLDISGLSEFISALKLALQVKLKLGYNNGGIAGFASIGKVAALSVGDEIVVGAECWLDRAGRGLGGAVSVGAGFALQLGAESQNTPVELGDRHRRARRIGGGFPERIEQALDLGLTPASVDPLLDILEPQMVPQPMAYAKQHAPVRTQGLGGWTINWDEVELAAQPTDLSCWAAAAAMVIGWRDNVCISPDSVAQIAARSPTQGLSTYDVAQFAAEVGLQADPPQCYTEEGFRQLIQTKGPLWVGKIVPPNNGHAVVVTGMYRSDFIAYVRVSDPWDRVVGVPGTPGDYAATHLTGSRYIMRFDDFQREYELAASGSPSNPQVLYAGGTFGHTLNTGQPQPPPGYAMAARGQAADNAGQIRLANPPPPRARSMGGGADAAIAAGTFLLETLRDNQGDVTWELDQLRSIKHPNDRQPENAGAFRDASSIRLDSWPVAGGAIDDISAWFKIDWQYNGRSLGNVRISNIGVNDAVGWGLHVRAQIMDDNRVYPPNDCAALRLNFHYRFTRSIGSDVIALTEVTLYGNGEHAVRSEWVQAEALCLDNRAQRGQQTRR